MKLGKTVEDGTDFVINAESFLSTHTFLQGITGSAKTGALLKILQELRSKEFQEKFGYIPIVIADEQDEFLNVPNTFTDFVIIEKNSEYAKLFTVDHAKQLGKTVREIGSSGRSIILKLSDFKKIEMQKFLSEFIAGFRIKDRKYWNPCVFIIDEADLFAPRLSNSISRESIVDMCKRGRKEGISVLLSTQNAYSVHMDARSQCTNRIIGNTPETSHRNACAEMLGLTKEEGKSIWGMKKGEFYIRGEFTDYILEHVQMDKAIVKTPPAGISIQSKTQQQSGQINALNIQTSRKDISVVDALESKIAELRNQIVELEKTKLTDEKLKKIQDNYYSYGFQACKTLQDDRSIEKKFKKVIGL